MRVVPLAYHADCDYGRASPRQSGSWVCSRRSSASVAYAPAPAVATHCAPNTCTTPAPIPISTETVPLLVMVRECSTRIRSPAGSTRSV